MLRPDNVCDKALLAAIIKASASEKGRSILQAAPTPKNVAKVGTKKQHDDSISKFASAVNVLTSKLTFLQQDVDNMKQKNPNSMIFLYTKCNVCTLNKVDKCTHCYLWGVEGHLARRCLARSNSVN